MLSRFIRTVIDEERRPSTLPAGLELIMLTLITRSYEFVT